MQESYLEVIKAIAELDPPIFVFGGIAEDVLLDRELSRSHGDIDIMVLREELAKRKRQCELVGFIDFEVYYEPIRGKPLVLGGHKRGLNLELTLCDKDGHDYYCTVIDDSGDLRRIYLPDDSFGHPPTLIEGAPIHTLSPRALYQLRAALEVTRSFGEFRPKDVAAQRRLKAALLGDQTEAALRPRIEKFGSAKQH